MTSMSIFAHAHSSMCFSLPYSVYVSVSCGVTQSFLEPDSSSVIPSPRCSYSAKHPIQHFSIIIFHSLPILVLGTTEQSLYQSFFACTNLVSRAGPLMNEPSISNSLCGFQRIGKCRFQLFCILQTDADTNKISRNTELCRPIQLKEMCKNNIWRS
jgi:hypothetical protein